MTRPDVFVDWYVESIFKLCGFNFSPKQHHCDTPITFSVVNILLCFWRVGSSSRIRVEGVQIFIHFPVALKTIQLMNVLVIVKTLVYFVHYIPSYGVLIVPARLAILAVMAAA